jgi:hypothetical protein
MGQMQTEQAVRIIEAVGEAMPDPRMQAEPNMTFWPLLLLAVIPVAIGALITWRKK